MAHLGFTGRSQSAFSRFAASEPQEIPATLAQTCRSTLLDETVHQSEMPGPRSSWNHLDVVVAEPNNRHRNLESAHAGRTGSLRYPRPTHTQTQLATQEPEALPDIYP